MYEMKLYLWKVFPFLFPFTSTYLLIKTLYFVKIKCYNIF